MCDVSPDNTLLTPGDDSDSSLPTLSAQAQEVRAPPPQEVQGARLPPGPQPGHQSQATAAARHGTNLLELSQMFEQMQAVTNRGELHR